MRRCYKCNKKKNDDFILCEKCAKKIESIIKTKKNKANFNCILCKYFRKPDQCRQLMLDSQMGRVVWHCPTLSNLYYGKLIYYFPCNLIFKLQTKIWDYLSDKEYYQ